MKRNTAFVLAFCVLLIFVVVFCAVWFFSADSKARDNDDPAGDSELIGESPSPEPPPQSVDQDDDDTQTQDVTASQEPAYVQSPEPEAPIKTSSGSFSSNTGTALNLVVSWTAGTRPTGEIDIAFDIGISSYAFYTDSLPGGLLLTVGDAAYTLTSAAVAYDGQTLKTSTLATYTATLPPDTTSADVTAKWIYQGTYSGVEIENIEISETLTF